MTRTATEITVEALMKMNGSTKPVFIHRIDSEGARWHYGECFPDTDTCAIATGADLDAEDN